MAFTALLVANLHLICHALETTCMWMTFTLQSPRWEYMDSHAVYYKDWYFIFEGLCKPWGHWTHEVLSQRDEWACLWSMASWPVEGVLSLRMHTNVCIRNKTFLHWQSCKTHGWPAGHAYCLDHVRWAAVHWFMSDHCGWGKPICYYWVFFEYSFGTDRLGGSFMMMRFTRYPLLSSHECTQISLHSSKEPFLGQVMPQKIIISPWCLFGWLYYSWYFPSNS